ncbi:HIRAN domain-containing protein [Sphingomonas bisphenolicum]
MSLQIKGAQHPNANGSNRQFEILTCAPGEPIELRPEPKNKHDPLAIAIYSSRNFQIGYVSAERCGRIGQLIRQGREVQAIFQGHSQAGAWVRVAFDGETPTLPPIARSTGSDNKEKEPLIGPDFYPDDIWPDD